MAARSGVTRSSEISKQSTFSGDFLSACHEDKQFSDILKEVFQHRDKNCDSDEFLTSKATIINHRDISDVTSEWVPIHIDKQNSL